MDILEFNPQSGYIVLYHNSHLINLHEKYFVDSGLASKQEDGVYCGRMVLTLSKSEAMHLIYEWHANGPFKMQNEEDAHRLPDGLLERIRHFEPQLRAA